MIARFRILVPNVTLRALALEVLEPWEVVFEGNNLKMYPPYQSLCSAEALERSAINQLESILAPAKENKTDSGLLVDGKACYLVNAIQIDCYSSDFQRAVNGVDTDPPSDMFIRAANVLIEHIRGVTEIAELAPLGFNSPNWVISYINDDGSELPIEPGKCRVKGTQSCEVRTNILDSTHWRKVMELGLEYHMPLWENLFLDARKLLPEIGPAIVLLASSLERAIADCLDHLATQSSIPRSVWEWIKSRENNHYKEPSYDEQFGILLKLLSGKSLKEEIVLWKYFKNIIEVRNKFVHEGMLESKGNSVDLKFCNTLFNGANLIFRWLSPLMNSSSRRVLIIKKHSYQYSKNILKKPSKPKA